MNSNGFLMELGKWPYTISARERAILAGLREHANTLTNSSGTAHAYFEDIREDACGSCCCCYDRRRMTLVQTSEDNVVVTPVSAPPAAFKKGISGDSMIVVVGGYGYCGTKYFNYFLILFLNDKEIV